MQKPRHTSAQQKVRKKIKDLHAKKAEIRAEMGISVALRKETDKRLKGVIKRNETSLIALERHYDDLISALEKDLEDKRNAIEKSELILEEEYEGHNKDISEMRKQLDELQLKEESLRPKKHCTHCGQVLSQ
jgi:type I site-specific restriction endonuclease